MKRICGLPLLALVGLVLTLPAFSKGTEKKNENVIIDQPYVTYHVDRKTGDLTVGSEIMLPKKNNYLWGYAGEDEDEDDEDGLDTYLVDTASRTITVTTHWDDEDDEIEKWRYSKDGAIVFYRDDEDEDYLSYYVKANAKFNAEKATEVIGKTFSGKWTDDCTASITFGKNGKATVEFSNGDKGSGSYLASDDDNIVVYNHNNKGVWFAFTYSDTDKSAVFYRKYVVPNKTGNRYSMKGKQYTDWKVQ